MNSGKAGSQGKLVHGSTRSLSSPSSALITRGLEHLARKQIDHATTLIGKGDKAGAVVQLREALNLTPMDIGVRLCLAILLETMGDILGAIAEYREAIRLKPDDASAHSRLGETLVKSGDLQGAIAAYQEAIRLEPEDMTSHLELGQALRATGQWANASIEFYRVLYLAKDLAKDSILPYEKETGITLNAELRELFQLINFEFGEETEIARNALRDMGFSVEIS
jgi:Flp pilus assembly protein TadD